MTNKNEDQQTGERVAEQVRKIEAEREEFTRALLVAHDVAMFDLKIEMPPTVYKDEDGAKEALREAFTGPSASDLIVRGFLADACIHSAGDGVHEPLGDAHARAAIVSPFVLAEMLQAMFDAGRATGIRDCAAPDVAPMAAAVVRNVKTSAIAQGRAAHRVVMPDQQATPGAAPITVQ